MELSALEVKLKLTGCAQIHIAFGIALINTAQVNNILGHSDYRSNLNIWGEYSIHSLICSDSAGNTTRSRKKSKLLVVLNGSNLTKFAQDFREID